MSNRRAQDERIEGTPDGSNAISEIVDVPDAPIIGSATAGLLSASVAFTPATTGGTVSLYTATSTPDSITGTSATSPITVNGLTAGTSYTFTVRGSNSTGSGASSSASNSATPIDVPGSYDALASITLSANADEIIFSNIPSEYKHLQLRYSARTNRTTYAVNDLFMGFNIDNAELSSTKYSFHYLRGDGSSIASGGTASTWRVYMPGLMATQNSSGPAVGIVDILDYSNVNKYKTVRMIGGFDTNGTVAGYGGFVGVSSGNWRDTSAINSIRISADYLPYLTNSVFSLYGVK